MNENSFKVVLIATAVLLMGLLVAQDTAEDTPVPEFSGSMLAAGIGSQCTGWGAAAGGSTKIS